jgi:hypothetical protein
MKRIMPFLNDKNTQRELFKARSAQIFHISHYSQTIYVCPCYSGRVSHTSNNMRIAMVIKIIYASSKKVKVG